MVDSTKLVLITILVTLVIGYGLGRYVQPARIEVKEVVKTEQIEVVHHDVQTVVKEIVRPDGTKETETVVTDHTQDTTKSETEHDTQKIVDSLKPDWIISGTASVSLQPVYGGMVQRRILGPVFIGVAINTNRDVTVNAGVQF